LKSNSEPTTNRKYEDANIFILTRQKICILTKLYQSHPLNTTKNDIAKLRDETHSRLLRWRTLQAEHMPMIREKIIAQLSCAIEDEKLFLPSSFVDIERDELGLSGLAEDESKLREGQACGAIVSLRFLVKMITSLQDKRKADDAGQQLSTRARSHIQSVEATRDRILHIYNITRKALMSLGKDELVKRFPPLSHADLFRKSTEKRRQLNDTYREDGRIWGIDTFRGLEDTSGKKFALSIPLPPLTFILLLQVPTAYKIPGSILGMPPLLVRCTIAVLNPHRRLYPLPHHLVLGQPMGHSGILF
jgi:hypothetical protein